MEGGGGWRTLVWEVDMEGRGMGHRSRGEKKVGGKRERDLRVTTEKQMSQSLCQSTDLQSLNHTHKDALGLNP